MLEKTAAELGGTDRNVLRTRWPGRPGDPLKAVLRRLKLSLIFDVLPERLVLSMPAEDAAPGPAPARSAGRSDPRESRAAALRAERGHLEPCLLEAWEDTAKVTFDRTLLNELAALRFLESHHHVLIVGPVGVGKTFIAHAIGHIACRRGYSVLATTSDETLKSLRQARQMNAYEAELCKLISIDLLILDDFCLDAMDQQESRDAYEILTERQRAGSVIVTPNRGPDEWLATPSPTRYARRARSTASSTGLRPRHRRVLSTPAQTSSRGHQHPEHEPLRDLWTLPGRGKPWTASKPQQDASVHRFPFLQAPLGAPSVDFDAPGGTPHKLGDRQTDRVWDSGVPRPHKSAKAGWTQEGVIVR